jgi:hypothetical protein
MGTLVHRLGRDLEYLEVLARIIGRTVTTGSMYGRRDSSSLPRLGAPIKAAKGR